MKAVTFHPDAKAEYDAAIAYYEGQRSGLGTELQTEVEAVVTLVRQFPQLGFPFSHSRYRFLLVNRFPYVVYYADEDAVIRIMAVAHERRKPGYWRKRRL